MLKIGKRRVVVVLAIVLPLFVVALALSASPAAVTSEVGNGGLSLSVSDLSAVPQSVIEDANRVATELFVDGQEQYDDFVNQLLAAYLESTDKDFVIIFNSGGWGWKLVEASPGWLSISAGIESELNSSDYTLLLLTYQRTVDTLQGRLDELVAMITGYSSKSKELAYRVEFLTSHNPNLRVILTGESLGAVISDQTMNILADNPQVYSIQTGPPFWHTNVIGDRTLVVNDNGMFPDSFSQGDFFVMLLSNLEALFGLPQPENEVGTIFHRVRAPGHSYWWQYPGVCSSVADFLDEKFGIK